MPIVMMATGFCFGGGLLDDEGFSMAAEFESKNSEDKIKIIDFSDFNCGGVTHSHALTP